MRRLVPVAPLADVPENGNKAFDVEGASVLVCRTPAGVFAIENKCSHADSPLEGGRQRGASLFCPLHGARFDLRTGAPSGTLTTTPVRTYAVELREGTVLIGLDD